MIARRALLLATGIAGFGLAPWPVAAEPKVTEAPRPPSETAKKKSPFKDGVKSGPPCAVPEPCGYCSCPADPPPNPDPPK